MSDRFFIHKWKFTIWFLLCAVPSLVNAIPTITWTNLNTPSNISGGFVASVLLDATGSGGVIELQPNSPTVFPGTVGTNVISSYNVGPAMIGVSLAGDTIIRGNAAGNSRLYVYAQLGAEVVFDLSTYSLTFEGSANGDDLLIAIQGQGKVVFVLGDGKKLILTNNSVAGGGRVQMYRQLDDNMTARPGAQLIFVGNTGSVNPEVVIEEGSIVSYLGYTAQPNAPTSENGIILFDTTNNSGSNEMILTIGQLGAVIVRGRLVSNVTPPEDYNYTLADIDPSMPAGFNAIFNVINMNGSSASGGLLVQNYNNTLGELIWDPWCNLDVRSNPPFGNFNGVQWGFVLGSYATLNVNGYAYLDYVSLTGTQCPVVSSLVNASSLIKSRNPSALFTDGQPDPLFIPPQITIGQVGQPAGIFFRSGVDNNGTIRSLSDPNPFTIDPANRTPGEGFVVFDIEGPLNITGFNTALQEFSGIELLSLEVDPTGGSLFVGDGQTIFPLRTFATQSVTDQCTGQVTETYLSYNNACFLNNGRVNLQSVSIIHTDQNHHVFEDNDVASEPAYIGGETWLFKSCVGCIAKPKWAFYNSRFDVQTSVALTGVDLLVPNGSDYATPCGANLSQFAFYQNGKAIDHGNGRNMILGTYIGSTACDGCTVLDKDAQLDVMQDQDCDSPSPQELQLVNGVNDNTIVQGITGDISNQYSIQTIYLGNNSNISVGTQGSLGTTMSVTVPVQSTFPLTTLPILTIDGNFFSFETRGGENGLPDTSNVTGQGGIFVDTNGTFQIGSQVCGYRTNIGAMVTKSSNGVINLPSNRVFFDPTIGIATWNLDLSDSNQWVIVPNGVEYEEYNLNWMFTIKDYNQFMPYYLTDCYNPCVCPPVIDMNVTAIPEVQGTVQQFNIQGSRIGDPAHLKVNGGTIEELVMLVGFNSAEAPVAVLVLENNAEVGLGSTHRNVDSLHASVQLGVNGINLIMDGGDATVVLNEDVIINNICSILPGPNISSTSKLKFTSDCCKTLRVTKDGILDLSGFDEGQVIEFAGNVHVVFEPGSTVIYNPISQGTGPTLRFADQATCLFEPVHNLDGIFGTDLTGTDTVRVVFTGVGVLEFADCARADLPRDAFVGIESLASCDISGAVVRLHITDSAEFYIGDTDCRTPGGVLQVGNTIPFTMNVDPVITFSLILDGPQAKFEIGPQGFLGLGMGIVNKPALGHDNWLVTQAYNLNTVSLDLPNGIFRHAQLYAGNDDRSALIALGDSILGGTNPFEFYSDPLPGTAPDKYSASLLSNTNLLGGGNIIAAAPSTTEVFAPVVDDVNGAINSGQYFAGILASTPILQEPQFSGNAAVSAQEAQLLLRAQDILLLAPTTNRAVAAPSDLLNQVRVGYIDSANIPGSEGLIGRIEVINILGKTPQTVVQQHTLQIGVAQVTPTPLSAGNNPPRPILSVNELGN